MVLARTTSGIQLIGDDDGLVPLTAADPSLGTRDAVLAAAASDTLPDPTNATEPPVPATERRLGTPIAHFGKLWGIGLNYADHATDLDETQPDEPASFMKPSTSLAAPGGPIVLPPEAVSERVTAEAEIGVVVGRRCRTVDERDVDDVVAGFVPVIDVTAEDVLQRNPRFLTRAKSFDSFLVVGPSIAVGVSVDAIADVEVRTVVNDEVVAHNTVENMLFPPAELISFHSQTMTLEPGDLISTGTPGAAQIEPGDVVRAEVDHLDSVEATVVRSGAG